LEDASESSAQYRRELMEQLDRASLSMLLNTAEGNGKRQGPQRAKFFDDARGSAFECAACLDASVAKGFVSVDRVRPGKEMLGRVVAMLTRLIDRFDTNEIRIRGSS
jgi:four helix bundle protein